MEQRILLAISTRSISRACSSARSRPASCRSRRTRCSPPPTTSSCSTTAAPARWSCPRRCCRLSRRCSTSLPFLKHVIVSGKRRARARCACNAAWRKPAREFAARADHVRRRVLLALFVGLDRHAEGHGARPFEPDPDRRALRQAGARHSGKRRRVLRGEAVLRLRARQRADLSAGGRRDRGADGRAADAGRGVQAPEGAQPDDLLRRADAVRGDAREPGLAAQGGAARCASAPRRARRCPPISASAGPSTSASTSSTASARPRCCTSSCPTGRATCATARPASRCPATRCAWSTSRAAKSATGEIGELQISGPTSAIQLLEQPRPRRCDVRRRVDAQRRQVHRRRRRLLHLRRPHRRHAQGGRHLRLAVRGRGGADDAPGRCWRRRWSARRTTRS